MEHTGFGYKGQTVECSSGVQHFTRLNKKWTHWAMPRGISSTIPEPTPDAGKDDHPEDGRPTIRRGSKGEYVTLLQTALIQRGYDLGSYGADGDFGRATEAAVKEFQADNGLTADGICGQKTWAAIDGDAPALYTVTIPHLTRSKAEALVGQYAGSAMTEEGR